MRITHFVSIASIILLSSCSTSTKLSVFWSDKNYEKGKIDKVLILGITKREAVRRTYEEDMVMRLAKFNIEGVSSADLFPIDQKLDTNAFRLHFANSGFDIVITSQLVSADKNQRYEPGYSYTPSPYSRGFHGYYGSSYGSTGYVITTTTLKIETHVYDTKTEGLIWSGISDTFDPSNEMDAIKSLNKALIYHLSKQGYFVKKRSKS